MELPDAAALASAWLALNDAVLAYIEAEETPGRMEDRLPPLIDRLDLVTAAVAATMAVLPPEAGDPLAQVVGLTLRPAGIAPPIPYGHRYGHTVPTSRGNRRRSATCGRSVKWWRWDSNPRGRCRPTAFRVRRTRPGYATPPRGAHTSARRGDRLPSPSAATSSTCSDPGMP